MAAKKDRATGSTPWYFEEQRRRQMLADKQQQQEQKKAAGGGWLGRLTRMVTGSSSKLTPYRQTESTSRLPRMDAMNPEKSFSHATPPQASTPEPDVAPSPPASVKRNRLLRSLIYDQPAPISESPELEEQENSDMFVLEGRRVVRRSMPMQVEDTHMVDLSPMAERTPRRSIRLTQQTLERLEEEVRTESANGFLTPEKERVNAPIAVHDDFTSTPTRTSDRKTPKSGLRPGGTSSSTLSRISGMIKRGISSVGKGKQSQPHTPVSKLIRRDTLESTKSEGWKRRRYSDVGGYAGLQGLMSTPTSSTRMLTDNDIERLRHFQDVVQISPTEAKSLVRQSMDNFPELPFDAIVADALIDGKPISAFSEWLFKHFDIMGEVQDIVKMPSFFGNTVKLRVPRKGTGEEIIIAIGVLRERGSNAAAAARIGYDSAITLACQGREKTRVLVVPAFFPCDTQYNETLADAMLRTVFRITHTQPGLSSVIICGQSVEERMCLQRQFDKLIYDKSKPVDQSMYEPPNQ
ncbi:unnamed protein product, partial [Mesorhabditis spiculigera]